MNEPVIDTQGLTKSYRSGLRRQVAVADLDLSVTRGEIHGFLGPSGSGKTTVIRILVGLVRPDRGVVRVLGAPVPGGLTDVIARVGASVGEPAFAPDLTARRNLSLLARAAAVPRARVDELIERFELPERTTFARFSQAMRQRLATAAALLREPELLILDEPAQGLDPAGVSSLRDVLGDLRAAGSTVLLSSHVLAEVQQVCDSVSILDQGRLVTSGPVHDLLGASTSRTRVGVSDSDAAEQVLRDAGYLTHREDDELLVEGHEAPERITQVLAEHGHYVSSLTEVRPDLESIFLELTGHYPVPEDQDGGKDE